jgi:UDP-N-acetylglucosamine/UDP-N-acetylgalactosamine 4-epimerase
MRVLVTGGAGFIGSHICDELTKKGHFVLVIDNLSTGSIKNIEHLQNNKNFVLAIADITQQECCYNLMKTYNIDAVCHQAALGSVPRSVATPNVTHDANVQGFFNVLNNARLLGIKRFVFASSSSVYGTNNDLPKVESNLGQTLSPYAASKYIDEVYANTFSRCYDMETIGLRYFNIFGPRQSPNGPYAAVIPKFVDNLKQNNAPYIYGDGTYSRDFTYVKNAVQANVLALTTTNKEAYGEAFNIGSGGRVTIKHLYDTISKEMNKTTEPCYTENRKGDVPHSMASIEKASKLLGYNVETTFEEGIKTLLSPNSV